MELKTSENHLNKFERGKIDIFHFEIENIGAGQNKLLEPILQVEIMLSDGHDY